LLLIGFTKRKRCFHTPSNEGEKKMYGEMITAVDASKYCLKDGKNIHILKDINLHIESGDFIAITGTSGLGRTVLMRLFCGIEKPDEGNILFCDVDTKNLSKSQRRILMRETIGTIFQDEKLNPFVSVVENVSIPLILKGEKYKAALEKSRAILDNFGLGELGIKNPGELSKEQKQMVIIARAIIKEPHIIIADELTSNLNYYNREKIMRLLDGLNQSEKTTIIISTSDDAILKYAGKVICLNDGAIIS
jgi:putative ABC transport system ATP-binding protein